MREIGIKRERDIERKRDRQTEREGERQREKDTERERDIFTLIMIMSVWPTLIHNIFVFAYFDPPTSLINIIVKQFTWKINTIDL